METKKLIYAHSSRLVSKSESGRTTWEIQQIRKEEKLILRCWITGRCELVWSEQTVESLCRSEEVAGFYYPHRHGAAENL